MRLADRLTELAARAKFGMTLGLDRVRAGLAEVGNPHETLAAVHIAGSNGKGSTSAMVESIARAAGLTTGLYTSPHLARFAERIRIDGEPIADAPFEAALTRALHADHGQLTFFECLTVAAFLAFHDAAIDLAVLEVGLGGRLDATNVIARPVACAITSISLEHTAVLGSTLQAIAREKAGILKPGVPYVLGRLPPVAEQTITAVAREVGAGPRWDRPQGPLPVALRGEHQQQNAAVASALATLLAERWPRVRDAIPAGLAAVRWPGRFEKIALDDLRSRDAIAPRTGVTILFDAAHNDEGMASLRRALADDGLTAERTTLVFGALADKAYDSMLALLAPCAARRIYTTPKGRTPAPFERLTSIAPGAILPDPAEAIARAIELATPGGTVLVTGSLYLVGEVRAHLLGLPSDPIIPL